jgi:hypothetical protein
MIPEILVDPGVILRILRDPEDSEDSDEDPGVDDGF